MATPASREQRVELLGTVQVLHEHLDDEPVSDGLSTDTHHRTRAPMEPGGLVSKSLDYGWWRSGCSRDRACCAVAPQVTPTVGLLNSSRSLWTRSHAPIYAVRKPPSR
jgi:hypothetical protein